MREELIKEVDLDVNRILGKYTSEKTGNLLLITAGVHGNELSGVLALERVIKKLHEEEPEIKGQLLGLAGNVKALNEGKRYIDRDLNRVWPDKKISIEQDLQSHEEREMMGIMQELDRYPVDNFGKRFFVDCHSTSSDSPPYISVQNIGDNDIWAHDFPLYIVRGFSDLIQGSIDNYFSKNQFTGFAYEGGQHFAKSTVDHQEAIIWMAMEKAGLLELQNLKEYPSAVSRLKEKEERKTFEIVHRHKLEEGDYFEMKAGFKNFQPIKKGEVLAIHNDEEITSEWDAYIFMPLYQDQGDDGFFVVEEV